MPRTVVPPPCPLTKATAVLLAYPFRVLVPRRAAPEAATSTAVALLLLAGAVGLVPASVVIALAAGAGATLAGCDSPGWPDDAAPIRHRVRRACSSTRRW